MINCDKVYKRFGDHEVLCGLDLNIPKGDITVVIGRSGGGKSVFLKHLVGLYRPDSGRIMIDGKDLVAAGRADLKVIREKIGIVFQGGALFDSLSVFENVAFPLRHKTKTPPAEIKDLAEGILEQIGMADKGDSMPAEISGGMAKRVALARALVTHPEIILFDEPVTGLDPITRNTIFDLIGQVHDHYNFTGVIVSHTIPDIFVLADRVAMLHLGRIIAVDTPAGIAENEDPTVRFFLSGGREKS